MTIGASIPSLVVIVVIYLAVGINDHAAMIGTALIVAPAMIYAVWDGVRAINPELQEMARTFAVPRHHHLAPGHPAADRALHLHRGADRASP